ncbi:MAG: sulfide/dihydroorotate dehydrogenase-like FAD/NAD-binding protein, partial [Candidatus Korarchaeum sp.]|nr:sulfide/dihydroorotate dehydrogenase-like FAD/NAD-binding protein [Candidatus Korarchaeum sp.]
RNKQLVILEEEFREVSDELLITTDDGSYVRKGFTTEALSELLESGRKVDYVFTAGPVIMMKKVADITRKYGIRTYASLNPIMVDGTGMCGACRVTVGGQVVFACVAGPDFDAHQVDFDELIKRLAMYREEEKLALERFLQASVVER